MESTEERAVTVVELVEDKEEYEELLRNIVTWHEEDYKAVKGYSWDGINSSQAPAHPSRLEHLVNTGILAKVYDANSRTIYQPTEWTCPECDHLNTRRLRPDPTTVECQLCEEEFKEREVDPSVHSIEEGLQLLQSDRESDDAHDFEPDVNLDALFDSIIGYEEIKDRFNRSIRSRSVRQSILLVGPPASAKSLFLREVTRIDNTARIGGASLTSPGLENKLMNRPSYIIIDELDELQDTGIYSVLMNYQDATMPYSITKSGKQDEITVEAKAPVFASANTTDPIPEPIMDRFWVYYFDAYTCQEFEQICVNLLPQNFDNIDEGLATYIAQQLRDWSEEASVRDAERIAENVETKQDVNEEIRVLKKYDSN